MKKWIGEKGEKKKEKKMLSQKITEQEENWNQFEFFVKNQKKENEFNFTWIFFPLLSEKPKEEWRFNLNWIYFLESKKIQFEISSSNVSRKIKKRKKFNRINCLPQKVPIILDTIAGGYAPLTPPPQFLPLGIQTSATK